VASGSQSSTVLLEEATLIIHWADAALYVIAVRRVFYHLKKATLRTIGINALMNADRAHMQREN